jgi:hypothetical protein
VFNISKSNDAFAILKKLQSASGTYPPSSTDQFSRLEETEGFGTNPGNLRMFSYREQSVSRSRQRFDNWSCPKWKPTTLGDGFQVLPIEHDHFSLFAPLTAHDR